MDKTDNLDALKSFQVLDILAKIAGISLEDIMSNTMEAMTMTDADLEAALIDAQVNGDNLKCTVYETEKLFRENEKS